MCRAAGVSPNISPSRASASSTGGSPWVGGDATAPVAAAPAARLASPDRRDAAQAPAERGWGHAAPGGQAGPSPATASAPALRQELVDGALVLRAASPRA